MGRAGSSRSRFRSCSFRADGPGLCLLPCPDAHPLQGCQERRIRGGSMCRRLHQPECLQTPSTGQASFPWENEKWRRKRRPRDPGWTPGCPQVLRLGSAMVARGRGRILLCQPQSRRRDEVPEVQSQARTFLPGLLLPDACHGACGSVRGPGRDSEFTLADADWHLLGTRQARDPLPCSLPSLSSVKDAMSAEPVPVQARMEGTEADQWI